MSLFRSVGPLAAATFATGTQTYVFSGLLADLAQDLNVSIGAAGQLATAYAITFAIAAPLMGALLSNMERRRILVLALATVALLNTAAALAAGYGSLLGLRILAGLAATCINPIAAAAAVALVPASQRGRALAIVTAGMTVAFMMGIPLGSAIGGLFGWRATFLFAASLAAIAALVVRLALPAITPVARPPGIIRQELKRPAIRSALLTSFLGFAAIFTISAYLGPVVTAITGATGASIGVFQACIGIGSLVGVPIGGMMVDRGRSRVVMIVAFALIALAQAGYSVLMLGTATALTPLLLGGIIFTSALALFSIMPAVQSRLVEAAPDATPLVLGLNGSVMFLGQGAGAVLGGFVSDHISFASIGFAGALLGLAGLGHALFISTRPITQTRS